ILPDLNQIDLGRVLKHEFGHFWGLVHSANPADLMYPVVSATVDGPRPGDFAVMRALGYTPQTPAPTPPPGGGGGGVPVAGLVIRVTDATKVSVDGYDLVKRAG